MKKLYVLSALEVEDLNSVPFPCVPFNSDLNSVFLINLGQRQILLKI